MCSHLQQLNGLGKDQNRAILGMRAQHKAHVGHRTTPLFEVLVQ
jgi:hypothetical protein